MEELQFAREDAQKAREEAEHMEVKNTIPFACGHFFTLHMD